MSFYGAIKNTPEPVLHLKGVVFNYDTNRICEMLASHASLHDVFSNIDGEYACVYTDPNNVIVCRDVTGTRPLYVYTDHSGIVGFSFDPLTQDTYGESRIFPKGSYWTSKYPDSISSINRCYSTDLTTVSYDDVIGGVVTLLLRAVEKRVSKKRAVVIPDGEMYSEILILVSNMMLVDDPEPNTTVILSTFGAQKLFENTTQAPNTNLADARYTYPFLDKDLMCFMQKFSAYWNKDMTRDLYSRLFTL